MEWGNEFDHSLKRSVLLWVFHLSGKADKGTDKLREWDSDKGGGGGQKIRKFCGRPK